MNGVMFGGCAAAVFVALVVALVLWRRERDDTQRWRSWYACRRGC